jgi:hypothetical protein
MARDASVWRERDGCIASWYSQIPSVMLCVYLDVFSTLSLLVEILETNTYTFRYYYLAYPLLVLDFSFRKLRKILTATVVPNISERCAAMI